MSEEIKQSIATAVANRKLLWYYTPSQNSAEELEGIFVQRESIAKDAVERIKEGALKDAKHHLLFVGPRGCGKTHLVSLIYHRLMAIKRVSSKLRVAWLNEDEMSPSFLDLLVRIYRALSSAYKDQFEESAMEPVYDLEIEDAEVFLRDLIIEKLGKQSLLVIVENLDELMKGLKTKGQMKWRAFIQDTKKCATLATAQKMVPAVKDRKAPFYGTFQVENLEMLSVKEAVELLKKVAVFYKDAELLEYLNTEPGSQRVECLHILTGGNHRVMIVLAQFVTKDSLEELIELFFKMLNELTPYYQERLRWISAQQRKVVTFLCSSRPTSVNAMAKKLFISEQTLSSQLRDLLKMGYVKRDKVGRESFYQIAEPLMRMCIEVKENNHREPILLIIEFLKIWCNKDTLIKQIEICEKKESKSIEYLRRAIETFDENEFAEQLKSCDDFSSYKEKQELKTIIDQLFMEEILDDQAVIFISWLSEETKIKAKKMINVIGQLSKSLDLFKGESSYTSKLFILAGTAELFNGNYEKAVEILTLVSECQDAQYTVRASFLISIAFYMQGNHERFSRRAIDIYDSEKLTKMDSYCLTVFSKKIVVQSKSWCAFLNDKGCYLNVDSFISGSRLISSVVNLICLDYFEDKLLESVFLKLLRDVYSSLPETFYQSCLTMSVIAFSSNKMKKNQREKLTVLTSMLMEFSSSPMIEVFIGYLKTGEANIELKANLNIEEQAIFEHYIKLV